MNNIDTITLGYEVAGYKRGYEEAERGKEIHEKILRKTWFDSRNSKTSERNRSYQNNKNKLETLYKHASYKNYYFTYNVTWEWLSIMIQHEKLKKYTTAEDIEEDVRKVIIEYFELSETDIINFDLKRIDIKNDYQYADEVEYLIIKYLINVATDKIYTYKKTTRMDSEKGYITTYTSKKSEYLIIKTDEL